LKGVAEECKSVMTSEEMARLQEDWIRSRNELAEEQRRLAQAQRELVEAQKETEQQIRETDKQLKETDRKLREVGKQLGGLGDKFGSFTEGLALPSMTKILSRNFQMNRIAPRLRAQNNGRSMELDVLGYSSAPEGDAVIVEVKSHLREEGLEQMRKILRDFREFFPEHAQRKVYGILAAVDISDDLREKVLNEGIYLARIHEGQFELQVPQDFQPQVF
jgi:hypothetical protein